MYKSILDIGQVIPDFEIATSEGKTIRFSDELNKGITIKLIFYRGHW